MFFEIGSMLYSAFMQKKPVAAVPSEYVDIVQTVAKKVGWDMQCSGVNIGGTVGGLAVNNKVMLALSGGLDSVYLMHKLKDDGYDVTALHVAGLNKTSSSYEEKYARQAAHDAAVEYVCAKFNSPRQAFPDNPFKNQLIMSMMLDIGVKRGIYRYAIGSDWTTPISQAAAGFTVTDSIEVNRAYWDGIKKRFPQAELIFISDDVKKYQRLQMLYDIGALRHVSSCIAPQRFRDSLHKRNQEKYHIALMDGRCGSCYKCAMEYILLVEAGRLQKNEQFYAHCWDTLATSKTSHRPDLFSKTIPITKRLQNLKDYGS